MNGISKTCFFRPVLFLAQSAMFFGLVLGAGTNTALGQQKSAADDKFAAEAASGGMAEVKLGELAQQKGTSDKVKDFGQKMVSDHSKAGDDLKQVAQQQGLNLPEEMSKQDQATYDRLSKLEGKQFDEAYARAMLTDHQKDVAAFEKEVSSGKNEALKEFASRTLPTLKEHLKLAHEMARSSTSASVPLISERQSARTATIRRFSRVKNGYDNGRSSCGVLASPFGRRGWGYGPSRIDDQTPVRLFL